MQVMWGLPGDSVKNLPNPSASTEYADSIPGEDHLERKCHFNITHRKSHRQGNSLEATVHIKVDMA